MCLVHFEYAFETYVFLGLDHILRISDLIWLIILLLQIRYHFDCLITRVAVHAFIFDAGIDGHFGADSALADGCLHTVYALLGEAFGRGVFLPTMLALAIGLVLASLLIVDLDHLIPLIGLACKFFHLLLSRFTLIECLRPLNHQRITRCLVRI